MKHTILVLFTALLVFSGCARTTTPTPETAESANPVSNTATEQKNVQQSLTHDDVAIIPESEWSVSNDYEVFLESGLLWTLNLPDLENGVRESEIVYDNEGVMRVALLSPDDEGENYSTSKVLLENTACAEREDFLQMTYPQIAAKTEEINGKIYQICEYSVVSKENDSVLNTMLLIHSAWSGERILNIHAQYGTGDNSAAIREDILTMLASIQQQ